MRKVFVVAFTYSIAYMYFFRVISYVKYTASLFCFLKSFAESFKLGTQITYSSSRNHKQNLMRKKRFFFFNGKRWITFRIRLPIIFFFYHLRHTKFHFLLLLSASEIRLLSSSQMVSLFNKESVEGPFEGPFLLSSVFIARRKKMDEIFLAFLSLPQGGKTKK